jgi:hypothetical protein
MICREMWLGSLEAALASKQINIEPGFGPISANFSAVQFGKAGYMACLASDTSGMPV